jgi:hypothetical protein
MFRTIVKEILIWIETFLRFLPGSIGNKLRRYWFRFRFKTRSHVFIEQGCEFMAPSSIMFKDDGMAFTCGKNNNGECGIGNSTSNLSFSMVKFELSFSQVVAGYNHVLALAGISVVTK